jgi:hypothetical protein
MSKIKCQLTVFFEDPFWVGVYERQSDNRLEVCKITFGSEPKDYEVYEFFLLHWNEFMFSPPVDADANTEVKYNPKRIQRAIKKQLVVQGVGTKSQQALKLQHEEAKTAHKKASREQRETEQLRQFELRQQKRKDKHRGH